MRTRCHRDGGREGAKAFLSDLQLIFATDKTNVTGDCENSIKWFSYLVTFDKCKTIIQIGGAIFNNNILQDFFRFSSQIIR